MLLVDVREPHRTGLHETIEVHGVEPISVVGELSEVPASKHVGVAIVELPPDEEVSLEKISAMRKLLQGVPIAVLHRDLEPRFAFELSKLGVDALVSAFDSSERIFFECLKLQRPRNLDAVPELVGESPESTRVKELILRAAAVDSNVLVTGETGTGKGVTARAIHRLSSRSKRPFVQVDCSALAPGLFESELFGHERGAFTGAVRGRQGRFDLAADGVIFLDEIGELATSLQSKFLGVLEDRKFERVGSGSGRNMTARVISATSRDLAAELERGCFRRDLYYRLRILEIRLPSLRERLVDIPDLVESGLDRISERFACPRPEVRADFIERLMSHTWPGNIRELMNLLEAVIARNEPRILEGEHVDEVLNSPGTPAAHSPVATLSERETTPDHNAESTASDCPDERAEMVSLLLSTGGNVARVARRMGMPRSTLRYKIKQYRLNELIPRD